MNPSSLPGPAVLFCPADRPDRYDKAVAAADVVVLDLEDAVAAADKQAGRAALIAHPLDPERVIVRVNASDSPQHSADLDAMRKTPYSRIMLAKTESDRQVVALDEWDVVALCETPPGILAVEAIAAAPNTIAVMWGAEDLIAAMGGRSSRGSDRGYRDVAVHSRSSVLLAAKAHRRLAIDAVYVDICEVDGLADEAGDAAASGFDLKACIHPTQVDIVRAAYRPTDEQIAWARRVLDAADAGGVVSVGGTMIDGPLIAQASQILRDA